MQRKHVTKYIVDQLRWWKKSEETRTYYQTIASRKSNKWEKQAMMSNPPQGHIPVLLNQVIDIMRPTSLIDGIIVDATFGLGNHSAALLKSQPTLRIIGFDRDREILKDATKCNHELARWQEEDKLVLCHSRMSHLMHHPILQTMAGKIDGILMDLGMSSFQIDQPQRGFSYRPNCNGILDMRMDQSEDQFNAKYYVNHATEAQLANWIYQYGQERMSRKIAKAIVEWRRKASIESTWMLAKIIDSAFIPNNAKGRKRMRYRSQGGNGNDNEVLDAFQERRVMENAQRTFQALRIHVNDELNELKRGLEASEWLLKPGGKLMVISFHSLEDSMAKQFLREANGYESEKYLDPELVQDVQQFCKTNRYNHSESGNGEKKRITFDQVSMQAIRPSQEEIEQNKRSKSAKLRHGTRTKVPSRWSNEME